MENKIRYIISFLEVIKNNLIMDIIDKQNRIDNPNCSGAIVKTYIKCERNNKTNLKEVKALLKGIKKEKDITNFKKRLYGLEKQLIIDGFETNTNIYALSYVVQFSDDIF